jgi:hypothetical protein
MRLFSPLIPMPNTLGTTVDQPSEPLAAALDKYAVFVGEPVAPQNTAERPQYGPILKGQTASKQRTGWIQQAFHTVMDRLMPQRSAPASAPRSVRLNLEGLERYIMPSAVITPVPLNEALIASNPEAEHYTEAVRVNFDTLPAGANANNSVVEYADTGRLRVSTGTGQSFIQENGSVRSGTNGNDHIIVSLLDGQRFVKSITYHSIGSGAGLINVSDTANHYSSISGSGTLTVNRFGDTISMVVQQGGIVLDSITFEVDRVREDTLPAPKSAELIVLEAALVQAEADKVQAQAVLDDLNAHPVLTTTTTNTTSNFSALGAGNLPDAFPITIPGIGGAKVYKGATQPISVTSDGALRSGANGSHLVVNFDAPAYVSTLTLKSWGGLSKYNLGSGYVTLTGGTQTITANRVMDSLSILVYGGAVTEFNNITTQGTQQVPTAAYTAALEAAQATVTSLNTQIATLIQQRDAQIAADAAANADVFIEAQQDEGNEAEPELTTVNFSSLAQTPLGQVTTVNLGDLGSTRLEQGGSQSLQVVGTGLQAGNGRDHVVLTFRDGQKFVTSVKVTYLGGTDDGRIAIGTDEGGTRYIPIGQGGVITIGQLVRSLGFISSGNGGFRVEEITQDMAQAVDAPIVLDWHVPENWIQALSNNNENVHLQNRGVSQSANFRAVSFNPDSGKYHLYELRSSGGALSLANVGYITTSGVVPLPQEYWERISSANNVFILRPGAPMNIVVNAAFTDGRPGGGNYEIMTSKSGEHASEVMPVQGTRLTGDVLYVSAQPGTQGFGNMVTEVPAGANAVMISTVRMLMNLRNTGIGAGAVTIRVRSGWDGGLGDPVVGSFQGNFQGLESRSLSFNVSSPNTANPGTETSPRQPQVTISAVMADGTEYEITRRAGRLPTSADAKKRIATQDNNGTWKLEWVPTNDPRPTVTAAGEAYAGFVTWKQVQIAAGNTNVADPVNYAAAFHAYLHEKEITSNPDVGGDPTPNQADEQYWSSIRATLASRTNQDLLQDFSTSGTIFDRIERNGQMLRGDTIASRVAIAVFDRAALVKNDPLALGTLAVTVERVLGIPAPSVAALIAQNDPAGLTFGRGVMRLFGSRYTISDYLDAPRTTHELRELASAMSQSSVMASARNVLSTRISMNADTMRIFIDVPAGFGTPHHMQINLVNNANGSVITEQVVPMNDHQLFVDIPLSTLASALNANIQFSLKTIVWFDGKGAEYSLWGSTGAQQAETVLQLTGVSNSNHPTLPASALEGAAYANILQQMAWPVAGTGWSNGIGSAAHYGKSLYAMDLNSSHDSDPVTSMAAGIIQAVNLETGMVEIRHTLPGGTDTWTTRIFHLTDILRDVTGKTYEGEAESLLRLLNKHLESGKAVLRNAGVSEATIAAYMAHNDHLKIKTDAGSFLPLNGGNALHNAITALPDFLAELEIVRANRQAVQRELNAIITDWKTRNIIQPASLSLGRGGNEGPSTGTHVHIEGYDSQNNPISLYQWAEGFQHGIISYVDHDNNGATPDMAFSFSAAAHGLINAEYGIAMTRSVATGSESLFYAVTNGFDGNQMASATSVKWDKDRNAWCEWNTNSNSWFLNSDNKKMKWVSTENGFIFLPD